jgi:hypothetical protein
MIRYKISHWAHEIVAVEITRESDSSVWYMYNGRERRESNDYYYKTAEDAKAAIVRREERDLMYAKLALERCELQLSKANAIDISKFLKDITQTA